MAVTPVTNATILAGLQRISSISNRCKVDFGVNALPVTAFGADTEKNAPGLFKAHMSAEGYFDPTAEDIEQFIVWPATGSYFGAGSSVTPFTILQNNADGAKGWSCNAMLASYNQSLGHGEQNTFTIDAEVGGNTPSSRFIEGTNLIQGSKSATGTGTSYQLGAVAANQRVIAALHVPVYTGAGSLIMKLCSDNATGFPSTTIQMTFATLTAKGAEWKELAGPIADDWWRAEWTFTGTTFEAYLLVAIITPRTIA
jgi:hypothetical protein